MLFFHFRSMPSASLHPQSANSQSLSTLHLSSLRWNFPHDKKMGVKKPRDGAAFAIDGNFYSRYANAVGAFKRIGAMK